jgi:predicted dehydrogenase
MGKEKLSVGVIGLGHWGPNVVRILSQHKDVDVRALCDSDPKNLEKVSRFLHITCEQTRDPYVVIRNPGIDAVAIITPASTHYELATAALNAGKHLFVEKPITLTVEENIALCELAEKKGLTITVGFTFLFNPAVHAMKGLLDDHQLGRPYYATAKRTHLGLIRKDVGVLWDLAVHDVSILNYLLDTAPVAVSGIGGNPLGAEVEDVSFLTFIYPDNFLANLQISWIDANKERLFSMVGSKARVVFDDLNASEPIRIFEKGVTAERDNSQEYGNFRFQLRDGAIVSPKVMHAEPLKMNLQAFIDVVRDGTPTIADARFSVDVTRAMIAAHESLKSGGRQIRLDAL